MTRIAILLVALLLPAVAWAQFGGVLGWQQSTMATNRAISAEERIAELEREIAALRRECK